MGFVAFSFSLSAKPAISYKNDHGGYSDTKSKTYEDGEGAYVTYFSDGTKARTYFDGYCYVTYYPDGTKKTSYGDGMGGYVSSGHHSYPNGYGTTTY